MFAYLNGITQGKLVGEHNDQTINHVGDVVLGDDGDCRRNNGDTGKKLSRLLSEQEDRSDKEYSPIEDLGDPVYPQHKIAPHWVIALFAKIESDNDHPHKGHNDIPP